MATKLVYHVTSGSDAGFRYGSVPAGPDTPQTLADRVAAATRRLRADLDGPLTIHVWPARDNEHYRQPIPDGAQRFHYPAAPTSQEH